MLEPSQKKSPVMSTAIKKLTLLTATLTFSANAGVLVDPAKSQNIKCTDKICSGTDIMGNHVHLEVHSDRLDRKQRYTARIGDDEITVERTRSPLVTADWNGPTLLQRPTTEITGNANGNPVSLLSTGSGLTTGTAFNQPVTCAVDGWSVMQPTPCF